MSSSTSSSTETNHNNKKRTLISSQDSHQKKHMKSHFQEEHSPAVTTTTTTTSSSTVSPFLTLKTSLSIINTSSLSNSLDSIPVTYQESTHFIHDRSQKNITIYDKTLNIQRVDDDTKEVSFECNCFFLISKNVSPLETPKSFQLLFMKGCDRDALDNFKWFLIESPTIQLLTIVNSMFQIQTTTTLYHIITPNQHSCFEFRKILKDHQVITTEKIQNSLPQSSDDNKTTTQWKNLYFTPDESTRQERINIVELDIAIEKNQENKLILKDKDGMSSVFSLEIYRDIRILDPTTLFLQSPTTDHSIKISFFTNAYMFRAYMKLLEFSKQFHRFKITNPIRKILFHNPNENMFLILFNSGHLHYFKHSQIENLLLCSSEFIIKHLIGK
jgi:hypothetical protein